MLHLKRKTLTALVQGAAEKYSSHRAFCLLTEKGDEDEVSYADFGKRARGFASVLKSIGITSGDRIMLIAENRPEWPIAYFGISLAGGVIVPVLVDFIPEHLATIAAHSGVKAICATAKTLPKLKAAGIDAILPILRLDTLDAEGVTVTTAGAEERKALKTEASYYEAAEDEMACIIYTSGTTGNSKGVMLSHKNLVWDGEACRSIIKIYPRDRFLSILPLAHTYECTIGLIIGVLCGGSTTYLDRPPSPAVLMPALKHVRPTIMLSVPLIMEKVYRTKIGPTLEKHPLYKMRLTRHLAVKAAGKTLLATFGGAIRFFGIGGAGLAPEVEAFLLEAGFPYAIGYGLTETAPLLAGAPPFKSVLRSTGPALEGVKLRIVDADGRIVPEGDPSEGEIQARGENVMLGYYKDPERTKEAFTDDGWFRTGDLGSRDKKGRIFIRGRLKAMILGPSGENIYPEEIENILNATGLVEESLVYSGEKGELVALVVLNEKAKTMLAAAGDAADEAKIAIGEAWAQAGDFLNGLKASVNKRLATFSRLHRVELHDEPFEKTATQKIKRFLYPRHKDINTK